MGLERWGGGFCLMIVDRRRVRIRGGERKQEGGCER